MGSELGGAESLCLQPLVLAGGLEEAAAASPGRPRRVRVRRRLLHEAAQRPPRPRVLVHRPENGETSRVSITREVNAEIAVSLPPPQFQVLPLLTQEVPFSLCFYTQISQHL